MKTLVFCTLISLISNTGLYAQKFQFGAEGGINVSGAIVKDPGGDPHGTPLPGFQIGGFGEYSLPSAHLAVGARLFFSYEGYKPVIYDTKASIHVSLIKIPLNIIYKPGGKDDKWMFGLGPYFGFGVGGHYSTDNSTGNIKIHFGNDPNSDDLRRIDIGADLMGGYKLNDQLAIRAAFDFGLIDYLTPGSQSPGVSAHSLSFAITGCYRLSK